MLIASVIYVPGQETMATVCLVKMAILVRTVSESECKKRCFQVWQTVSLVGHFLWWNSSFLYNNMWVTWCTVHWILKCIPLASTILMETTTKARPIQWRITLDIFQVGNVRSVHVHCDWIIYFKWRLPDTSTVMSYKAIIKYIWTPDPHSDCICWPGEARYSVCNVFKTCWKLTSEWQVLAILPKLDITEKSFFSQFMNWLSFVFILFMKANLNCYYCHTVHVCIVRLC